MGEQPQAHAEPITIPLVVFADYQEGIWSVVDVIDERSGLSLGDIGVYEFSGFDDHFPDTLMDASLKALAESGAFEDGVRYHVVLVAKDSFGGGKLGQCDRVFTGKPRLTKFSFICTTCGTQFDESNHLPFECAICQDERQYVGWSGQRWTTLDKLRQSHRNVVRLEELGLYGIGMEPAFAIGQRALLVTRPEGNVLWDCIPLLDEALIEMVRAIGGVSAIAISHPHYYASMIEWSEAFDCPIFLHAADRQWVMRSDPSIEFWDGDTKEIGRGLTLIRCGGHFEGGTVLHWPEGAGGAGVILSGDILQVVQDRRWVSFMYSYPNLIPLPASTVRRIAGAVAQFEFDRIYGAWWGKTVFKNAKAAVERSAERYIRAVEE